jgi:hypothetical protein
VAEGEGHRRQRLAAAGGDAEAEQAGWFFGFPPAGGEHLGADAVDPGRWGTGGELVDVPVEPSAKVREVVEADGEPSALVTAEEALGVEEVGVDQGGEEEAGPQLEGAVEVLLLGAAELSPREEAIR